MAEMPDYSIFYKKGWTADGSWPNFDWDLFLSAFNSSDRVRTVFERVAARDKHWFISPEYEYKDNELPGNGKCFAPPAADEATVIQDYFNDAALDLSSVRLCIDITGFMRPHLLVILKYLALSGVRRFDALYSEPLQYSKKEKTRFSDGVVMEVRQVAGFEGNHRPETTNDLLIIGAGYDHPLIAHAAESKESARKVQLLGLPSLRADMYQENVLNVYRASEQLGTTALDSTDTHFAPANDPFETANALAEILQNTERRQQVTNLYLCPVSTKVQVLGFGLYYLTEWVGKHSSIIFPFCRTYARETSVGLSRVWWYQVELPTT
jgi:hypothetical protein